MATTAQQMVVSTRDGLRLALTLHDRPGAAGMPVLLLHGLSQQRHFWGPVVRRMRSRPLAALDQRGHGDSDSPLTADYSIGACAEDIGEVLDVLGWERSVVVGHSWGASVALHAAATMPDRVAGAALIDGGLWSPRELGPRDEVRRRLTPPALGIPAHDLWSRMRSGDLGRSWSPEIQAALAPTFVADEDGNLRTRIGVDRHMRVLDGLLDFDLMPDLDAVEMSGVPVWAVVCEPRQPGPAGPRPVDDAARRSNLLVHRWSGAIHDVPLQWPSLVAGLVDELVEDLGDARDPVGGNE